MPRANQTIKVKDRTIQDEFDRIEKNERFLEQTVKPGMVVAYAGQLTTDPEGWLICDGRLVAREAYPKLYAAIGNRHVATISTVADTTTTFGLPDLMGKGVWGAEYYERLKQVGDTIAVTTGAGAGVAVRLFWLIKT